SMTGSRTASSSAKRRWKFSTAWLESNLGRRSFSEGVPSVAEALAKATLPLMHEQIEPRPDHRQRMPVDVVIRRPLTAAGVEHDRHVISARSDLPVGVPQPEQEARRVDIVSVRRCVGLIFLRVMRPVILRLHGRKQKRQEERARARARAK